MTNVIPFRTREQQSRNNILHFVRSLPADLRQRLTEQSEHNAAPPGVDLSYFNMLDRAMESDDTLSEGEAHD